MAKESSPKPAGLRLFGSQGAARSIKDRKSTRLNSSHSQISYAVFCLKKKKTRTVEEPIFADSFFVDSPDPAVPTFVAQYRKHFPQPPTAFSAQAYEATQLVSSGIRHI